MKYLIPFVILIALSSCGTDMQSSVEEKIYEGPTMELMDVEFYYSDSAQVKVKGTTPHRMEYMDGNQEYPSGLYLEFFDDDGILESTIKANKAYFNKEKNEWLGQGDVVVKNMKSGEELNTEELYWLPSDERIHTNKFVTIKREQEILYGTGLEATQDMSTYSIQNPTGEMLLKEGSEF